MTFLLRYRYVLLVLMALLAIGLGTGVPRLEVDHDMEAYFSPSGDDMAIYQRYKEAFGADDRFLLLAIPAEEHVYQLRFLGKLQKVKKDLLAIPGVRQVRWVDDWVPPFYRLDRDFVENLKLGSLFVSTDHRVAALWVEHVEMEDKAEIKRLIEAIESTLSPFPEGQVTISGKIYFAVLLEAFIREDSGRLFVLTLALLVLLLGLVFNSWRLLLGVVLVPLLSSAFTLGLMGHVGLKTNLFTAMIPTLILILSVADLIHLIWGEGPQTVVDRLRFYFPALWLTTLTTAIGFGSLMASRIPAFVEFGLFVAVGVSVSFTFTLLVYLCFPFPQPAPPRWFRRVLSLLMRWVQQGQASRRWKLGLLLGLTTIAAVGLPQVRQNAVLISGLPEDALISRQARFFDETFGGSRPLTFLVEPQETRDVQSLSEGMARIDTLVMAHFPVKALITPAYHRVDLPMRSADSTHFRFWGLIPDEGSARIGRYQESFQQAVAADPLLATWGIHYTGIGRMVDKNTEETTMQVAQGLLIALLVTFGLLALYFRDWRVPLVAVGVNLIPLALLAATYGWLGIELRAGTNIAFTIAFGIAIDDTMHLLNVYRQQAPDARDFGAVTHYAGRPVILTTLVLGLSFGVLTLAQLEGIQVLGLAMVVSALSALLADLFFLPVLLKWTHIRR